MRFNRLMVRLCLASAFTSAGAAAQESSDSLWDQSREHYEAAGISKPMFHMFSLWMVGQSHLGYCDEHLPADEVAHWRNWWERTVVPRSEMGRLLLTEATKLYEKGLENGRREPPSADVCQYLIDAWFDEMEAEAAKMQASPAADGAR